MSQSFWDGQSAPNQHLQLCCLWLLLLLQMGFQSFVKIFVGNKVELDKLSNLPPQKLIQIFRTCDNLASYEPGNMEYRGRAYSTEVGKCPVVQCKLEYE